MPAPFLTAAVDRILKADVAQIERPDTIAWLLLALRACKAKYELVAAAADRLVRFQQPDGALPVHPDAPAAHWPTAVAALAWHGLDTYAIRTEAAIRFVMRSTGMHWPRGDDEIGHDTSIVGWSWVNETHSWVEPTAIAMLTARQVTVPESIKSMTSDRIQSGVRLLLDRQLAAGGWNYGNTVVFRNSLKPLPEETSWALAALAPYLEREQVARSLEYLDGERSGIIAPVTLSAAMLAWSAWSVSFDAESMAEVSLAAQQIGGDYPIAMVAQLITVVNGRELILGNAVKP